MTFTSTTLQKTIPLQFSIYFTSTLLPAKQLIDFSSPASSIYTHIWSDSTCKTQLFSAAKNYTIPSPTMHSLSSPMPQQNTNYTFNALQGIHRMKEDNSNHYESINSNQLHSFTRLLADCSNCVTLKEQTIHYYKKIVHSGVAFIYRRNMKKLIIKGNVLQALEHEARYNLKHTPYFCRNHCLVRV